MKSFFETLPDRLFARRGIVLALVLAVTLAFAVKIPALKI